ncbi:MAG: hypothetical protein Q4G68_01335 [Planctomycetia bacterium]|nr:hypothetical protein [Planctomycetia bacterium]
MTSEQKPTKCLDDEVIRRCSEKGLKEMNLDLFQHMLQCEDCREKWRFELEHTLSNEFVANYVPTEADRERVRVFVAEKLKEEERWNQLTRLFTRSEPSEWRFTGDACSMAPPAMAAGGENARELLYSMEKAELKIVFSGLRLEDDPYYWEAILTIPRNAGPGVILPLIVQHGDGRPIESGTFVLCDQEFPVEDGFAELSFNQFVKNIRKHTVKLIFPDKQELIGTLKLL